MRIKRREENMGENESEKGSDGWKKFFKRHWNIAAVFIVAVVLAAAGAVYVYSWFAGEAQTTGMVPSSLGLWTMGDVVTFMLHLIFWELVIIGIPAAIGAVIGWQWWKKLPEEEKKEYHFFDKSSRTTSGGSGISMLFFIGFCLKVFIDGNWDVAISVWSLDYVVESMITILVWSVIIFGVPMAIGGIAWLYHEITKTS